MDMNGQYSIGGPDGPVYFYADSNGYIVKAWGQRVDAGGSPLIVDVVPPIGPLNTIDFGSVYRQLLAAIASA